MKALLVVDMQLGCVTGEPLRFDQDGTVRRINALAEAIRPRGLVVFIQHTEPFEVLANCEPRWRWS
jgi:nicotinamidase-related amidase